MKIKRRRPLTLLEIMIVIFLIGIIGSVLAYNMRGSLEEGRAYKSEHGSKQVHDFLSLAMAEGKSIAEIKKSPLQYLDRFGFVGNAKKLLQDGWGVKYKLAETPTGDLIVYSEKWRDYLIHKKKLTNKEMQEEYPWAYSYIDESKHPEEKPADEAKQDEKEDTSVHPD